MAQQYPLPKYQFQVDWGGVMLSFTEVTGLDEEVELIEYRHSDSKNFSKIKMPGMRKSSNITLKRGVFEGDFDFYEWMDAISNDRVGGRRDLVIRLMNEKHEPVAVWKAANCFPVKISAPELKSDANEVAIETLEVAHEGLSVVR
ncbi:MAG: phage tail protein [Saprospiraceae bacterium]|jgi:phage tail-like protein|nr:phage tail protein [Saprospiraceae bacterium]HRD83027.1 phage tail protein [Saprospiraceae bacterium]